MYSQQFRCQPAGGTQPFDSALSFLKGLNVQELQDLMDDNDRLNKLVDTSDIVKNQEIEKDTLLTSNKSIAEYNLSLEPQLVQMRQQLAETYEQAVNIQKKYEHGKLTLDSYPARHSLDVTLALLQTEAAKSEEESDETAETFLGQKSDHETFISKYIAERTLAHLRKVKAEKLAELIQDQQRSHSVPAIASSNPSVPTVPSRPAPMPPPPCNYPPMANNWSVPNPIMAPYNVNPMSYQMQMPNAASYFPR